jgi:hypothetical protein
MMNPWPYILSAYGLAALGCLGYLGGLRRRRAALEQALAALPPAEGAR